MHVCSTDTSGEIVDGLFYWVLGHPDDMFEDYQEEDYGEKIIFVPSDPDGYPARPIVEKRDRKDIFGCPADKTHRTRQLLQGISIVVEAGGTLPVFWNTENFFVMNDAIETMKKAGLRGTDCIRPKFETEVYTDQEMRDDLRVMTFPGGDILRPYRVTPPGADNCPFCGRVPIVCQTCGHINRSCPKCNKQIITVKKDLPTDSPLVRIRVDDNSVLDGSRWDGSDFLNPSLITRRALKLFQQENIGPCTALNCATYLGSCTPEQRDKLGEMSGLPL
ncbi:hypothetical protein DTL42_18060 [Bremerella cremea]|uniref:Uncharacterized protein n=1 Tax=Bremerella cremea TaxID=1031537 RepID=A0A368KMV2_9BACT|nr:hypothetical protein [Bremerella cremea]RCS44035.1 hypothetical protein DTL42_18060 [Bremerella cremea]